MSIVDCLGDAAKWKCYVVYKLIPIPGSWKSDKVPIDPLTGRLFDKNSGAHMNPEHWHTAEDAAIYAASLGPAHGVAIIIAEGAGLFCVDLDDALDTQGQWSPWAQSVVARFPGAAMELSASGRGMHILGRYSGALEPHSSKCGPLKTELYTRRRFIALTGQYWQGDINSDHTAALTNFALEYFPPRAETQGTEWTTQPVPQWSGPDNDAELIQRALKSHGAGSVFGGKAAFIDLYMGNADKLAFTFPSATGDVWDRSSADLALANHLAFWTGNNCERMSRIMRSSALFRDKWERDDYFQGTILNACATQREWYKDRQGQLNTVTPSQSSGPTASSDNRPGMSVSPGFTPSAVPVAASSPGPLTGTVLETNPSGRVTIPGLVIAAPTPLKARECPAPGTLVGLEEQQLMFDGCVYVEDVNMIMTPDGVMLDSQRFDNRFPGITFLVTHDGSKPTRSAWDTFVQSEMYAFPKVRGVYFAPRSTPGEVVLKDGMKFINSFVPVELAATPGDYSPFWNHLKKLLPNGRDAETLLYYMASVVQNPGVKFTWWPFIQGVPGNGKSFICDALQRCVGSKFTHAADASKLGGRFNAAFYGKLFVRIDEVKIDHAKGNVWESLKLLITQTELEVEAKGVDAVTREVCFNGMLLSNHKNGVRKTSEDRRIAPFFCAQQSLSDLYTQGMVDDPEGQTSKYFDALWNWAENGGWEIIRWLLLNTAIPDDLNPAKSCRRAPSTSSTKEAIMEGWGVAEQEVLEAITSGHDGFKGGWVSSVALDRLLTRIGKEDRIPRRARVALLTAFGFVAHPHLPGGRIMMADKTTPVLYLKPDNPAIQLTNPLHITHAYIEAQK